MADLKISQLTSATLPLAGTEVLPIVQSSSTKKVATDDLTVKNVRSNATTGILQIAGPGAGTTRTMTTPNANFTAARTDAAQSFTGDQTLGTGNLIQGTAAKGVNFTANTPAAGMTSQLLNWYEEGTWTGTLGGQTTDPTTPVTATGLYTRIGRQVTVQIYFVNVDTTGGSGNMEIRGLPFTPKGTTNDHYIGSCESYGLDVPNKYNVAFVAGSVTKILFQSMADDAAWTEPQLTAGATKFLAVTLTYFV